MQPQQGSVDQHFRVRIRGVSAAERTRNRARPQQRTDATRRPPARYRVRVRNTGPGKSAALVAFLEAQLKTYSWSKAELARRLGVERSTITRWMSGNIHSIQPEHVQRIAEVFAADYDELLQLAGIRTGEGLDVAARPPRAYPAELKDDVERQLWDLHDLDEDARWNLIAFYRTQQQMPRTRRRAG